MKCMLYFFYNTAFMYVPFLVEVSFRYALIVEIRNLTKIVSGAKIQIGFFWRS
jgi:hypothetical protein